MAGDVRVYVVFEGFGIGYRVELDYGGPAEEQAAKFTDTRHEARQQAIEFLFQHLVIREDQPCLRV